MTAENALFAGRDACGDFFDHFGLAHLVLAAVAVRGIDDQTMLAWSGSLGSLEIRQRLGHGSGIVVRTMRGTTQHQMAVGIALGLRGNHTTIQIDGEEMMLESGRETRIGRRLDGTIRSVLETDRHGHAGRQLAVHLAFRITRADRAPADQIANILRGNRIKPFRSGGQAEPQTSVSTLRAMNMPLRILNWPSRSGSLIRPFQPIVVRGSRNTRA